MLFRSRKALEDRGVEEPWRHVMVIGTGSWNPFTHTLVRNDPFTEAEVERLVREISQRELDLIIRLGYILGGFIGTILVIITTILG